MRATFLRPVLWFLLGLLAVEIIYGSALLDRPFHSDVSAMLLGWGLGLTFILCVAGGVAAFFLEMNRQEYEHKLRSEEQRNIMRG